MVFYSQKWRFRGRNLKFGVVQYSYEKLQRGSKLWRCVRRFSGAEVMQRAGGGLARDIGSNPITATKKRVPRSIFCLALRGGVHLFSSAVYVCRLSYFVRASNGEIFYKKGVCLWHRERNLVRR